MLYFINSTTFYKINIWPLTDTLLCKADDLINLRSINMNILTLVHQDKVLNKIDLLNNL
jgi:hypothetical protein